MVFFKFAAEPIQGNGSDGELEGKHNPTWDWGEDEEKLKMQLIK